MRRPASSARGPDAFEKLRAKRTPRPAARLHLGLAEAQAGTARRRSTAGATSGQSPADAPGGRASSRRSHRGRRLRPRRGPGAGPGRRAGAAAPISRGGAGGSAAPEERSELIRGMVAARGEARADGSDPAGWPRLGQAYRPRRERQGPRRLRARPRAAPGRTPGLLKAEAALLLGPPASADALPRVGDDAARLYARAAAAAPDDPEPQWFLGVRALQEGRQDEARERWRRVLAKLGPTSPTTPRSSSASTASAAEPAPAAGDQALTDQPPSGRRLHRRRPPPRPLRHRRDARPDRRRRLPLRAAAVRRPARRRRPRPARHGAPAAARARRRLRYTVHGVLSVNLMDEPTSPTTSALPAPCSS